MALLEESCEWPEEVQIDALNIHFTDSEYANNPVDA